MDGNTQLLLLAGVLIASLLPHFFMSRKRKKQQQELVSSFKVGDEIVTIGGIIGTIQEINEDAIDIKIDKGVKIKFLKSAISSKR